MSLDHNITDTSRDSNVYALPGVGPDGTPTYTSVLQAGGAGIIQTLLPAVPIDDDPDGKIKAAAFDEAMEPR